LALLCAAADAARDAEALVSIAVTGDGVLTRREQLCIHR